VKTVTLRAIFKRSGQKRGDAQLENLEEATRAASLDEEVESQWEAEWREHHLRHAMRAIASEFNDHDRQAFQWYAIEGRPVAEVAAALDMSPDAVYQAKSRILKRLSRLIEEQVNVEG
jgi:RNA polymerase sigma factor (sigma-70 family)